jgi:hypothetical protein
VRVKVGSFEFLSLCGGFGILIEQEVVRVVSALTAEAGEKTLGHDPIYSITAVVLLLIGGGVLTAKNLRQLKLGPLELTLEQEQDDAALDLNRRRIDSATQRRREQAAEDEGSPSGE